MSGRAARFAGALARAHGHRLLLALGATWKLRFAGVENVPRSPDGRGRVLFVFTHGVLLPLAYAHRGQDAQVLISESRDGTIITDITERMGFGSVRGSSTRGGERAAHELARRAREGRDLAVAPDGPRGPRGSVGPGAPMIAARAGVPIVPVGVFAHPAWRARSWDRFLVPAPGASVAIVYGAPLEFTRENAADESSTRTIENAMLEVERRAEELVRTKWRGVSAGRLPA
jgi:lysophospholipid acyltransferase (LPLAT)-like uncharacterized protein